MVRAIDLQTAILQTSPMEKIQQIQQHHAELQQKYHQLRLSEEDRLAREKVNDFKEADKSKIRTRIDRETREKGSGNKHQNQAELHAEESNEDSEEGGLINITV